MAPLVSLLRRREPKVVLEIGTYRGGTLWLWCRIAAPDAVIVSIDLPEGQFGGGYEQSYEDLFRSFAKPSQELMLIRKDSHDSATRDEVETTLAGRTIDFLFIDGDHTHVGVKQDFDDYSALVGEDGIIALHDILPHTVETTCEVHIFWEELKQSGHETREFVDVRPSPSLGQWGGVGVVFPRR